MESVFGVNSHLKELRAHVDSSVAFSTELQRSIAEHSSFLAQAKAGLRHSEELSRDRADLHRIFINAGGARTHTFSDLPLREVKAIIFEGLLARVLFKDDRHLFYEFNDQDHLTRSMLEWSRSGAPPPPSAPQTSI
ncbi:MAG TPA: hypothetical protein VF773_07745 [Verrucomicrobiae bacterium]